MAKTTYGLDCENAEAVTIAGSFETGTGLANKRGKGWTVTRTAAGKYKLEITSKKYAHMVAACATLQQPTAGDDKFALVGAYVAPTASANGSVELLIWDVSGAALADPSDDVNSRLNFVLVMSPNSKLTGP